MAESKFSIRAMHAHNKKALSLCAAMLFSELITNDDVLLTQIKIEGMGA
jgi:hypothetical protein